MTKLADNPAIQLVSLVGGGFPGRLLAAYCETGSLDANMRKACSDLASLYGVLSAVSAIAALACPPLAVFVPVYGTVAAIFAVLAKGGVPSAGDVSNLANVAGPLVSQFSGSNGLDMSKVADASGALDAATSSPDLRAAAGVAGALPTLGAVPPSCHPISAAERAAARAIALTKAKARARYKTAHAIALACAKVRAQQATARQMGRPLPPIPKTMVVDGVPWSVSPSCVVDTSTPTSTTTGVVKAPTGSSSKLAIAAAVALGAAKVFGVLG